MINEVFYSILIRSALMGLQLMFGGVFLYTLRHWYENHHKYSNSFSSQMGMIGGLCAFLFSLCFFFIRFYGGY